MPFALTPEPAGPAPERREFELPYPRLTASPSGSDPVVQSTHGPTAMPGTIMNFIGQSGSAFGVNPPDPVGAAGPNHYVQVVNLNIEIWNKSGTVLAASKATRTLWTGYTGTNPGNGCASRNDGDGIVLYDALADRWFVSQFSLPHTTTVGGPSFQCVAVSKTGDPAGAWWLYDFKYNDAINDYGKFGVWPDGYYASFNLFDYNNGPTQYDYLGADVCAYDRVRMLQGQPAAQVCFPQANTVAPVLPASLDGRVPPPQGEPGFFLGLDYNFAATLDLWKFHVDWSAPANSTLAGPAALPVAAYTPPCVDTNFICIPQGGTTQQLASLADRLMFRLAYRNFGTHEALLVNHAVQAGAGSGVRWYEIRAPNGTPSIFQQGSYAPADSNWRWMGSVAQDQAGDVILGYSLSSATTRPSIAWAGRLPGDPTGMMGQGEAVIDTGAGSNTGDNRWGDYTAMTVDPADDCTFWYTNELYPANGTSNWRTYIASVKFPTCGANDFSLGVSPASQSGTTCGGQFNYTVTTGLTKGAAESIALNVQDLPAGVTASFTPPSVTTGSSSTLTLTVAAGAPVTASPATFTVIGTAPSALHPATAQISIAAGSPPPNLGNTLRETHSASTLTFTWTDVVNTTGYIVEGATTPNGSFTTTVGTAGSGNPGVTAPLPAGNWYFEAAGQNACGTGPLN